MDGLGLSLATCLAREMCQDSREEQALEVSSQAYGGNTKPSQVSSGMLLLPASSSSEQEDTVEKETVSG